MLGFEVGVEQLFAALTVFVMASRHEALGSSVLDAMAQSVPVVATNAGGLKELLADGRGLLSEPGDAGGLAAHIVELLSQPERRLNMATHGLYEVQTRYGVEAMVEQYERLYLRAASSR